jgi:hypothetical protein
MAPPTRPLDYRPFDPAELGRVFTVQLREPPQGTPELSGRLTHAATGVASHFDTADELIALLQSAADRLRQVARRGAGDDAR